MAKAERYEIAARLKQARRRLFATAADAARALDMKPVTVRAHESGQNGVDYTDLERYARRYGVDIAWLLTGRGEGDIDVARHLHAGELIGIYGIIMDGQWLRDDPASTEYPALGKDLLEEDFVVYEDPRFPAEIIQAFLIRTELIDGPYTDGAIAFVVPRELIGYRDGDHVVIVIEDRPNGAAQWTLRRARRRDSGDVVFEAVLSDSAPIPFTGALPDAPWPNVMGVVVGSLQRRKVNELSLDQRINIEREYIAPNRSIKRHES